MDCTDIDYQNNSFDTVVDTFGLQASYNFKKQYQEMKRVCKIGGKIIVIEIGESRWKSINYNIYKNSHRELTKRGQHLYRNWDDLILHDNDVKIIKNKRKINGRLFIYVLEKK
jgi:methyltransferase OMS1